MATKKALSRNAAIAVLIIAVGAQIFTMCKKKSDQTPAPSGGQQQSAPQG